jgi:hypothetical protein
VAGNPADFKKEVAENSFRAFAPQWEAWYRGKKDPAEGERVYGSQKAR